MSERWWIKGGAVYDPANGVDGEARDLWIEGGKIIDPPADRSAFAPRILDARGLVVMPGGIDIHCHIAGPKVNAGRQMLPETRREPALERRGGFRSGTIGHSPTTFATGYRYAGLGYTTAFDAAIAPLSARHAHLEFANTPCIDKGCFLLMGNNHYVMEAVRDGDSARLRNFMAWLLRAGGGYAPKLVNPGGIENWKRGREGSHTDLESIVDGFDVTPRAILAAAAQASHELQLPHPLHIHCNNLGLPGNWTTTLATMQLLEGMRGHLTHIQFHSYAGGEADETTFGSRVEPLVEYFNAHSNLTVDVGQILFGATTSMTADSAVGHYLSRLAGTRWHSHDIELETGCGVSPIEYKERSVVHAWQWAIGLEWFLLAADPWRIALSTDHPNGGSFTSYPRIIRLLMDSAFRREELEKLPPRVRERTALRSLSREYSLGEICIITRAAPARMLGLAGKGHLGVGADADVTVYAPHGDRELMFQLPRHVLKAGERVIWDGELVGAPEGETLSVAPEYDRGADSGITRWIDEQCSIRAANYGLAVRPE